MFPVCSHIIEIKGFKQPEKIIRLPLYTCTVEAGFPSPADDHLDNNLDIVELMVKRPAATFYIRARGKSMLGAGILTGDYLVVDRSVTPVSGSMVVAVIDGDCLVKIYQKDNHRTWLESANPDFPDIRITHENDFQVWGVVTGVLRQHGSHGRVCTD